MNNVEVVHFNPKRRIFSGKLGQILPIKRPLNNFGDLLGPEVINYFLKDTLSSSEAIKNRRLLTIGSIMHFAKDGDVIWGTGVNGKIDKNAHLFKQLDVRAVRGPLTRNFLLAKGVSVPEIYGDPGLLTPLVFPHLRGLALKPKYDFTFIPNYNDIKALTNKKHVFNPRSGLLKCLERIAQSRVVVGSSLHAIIIAESLGIPARLIKSNAEDDFKYHDYYLGTGRSEVEFATDLDDALTMGGTVKIEKDIISGLLESFPFDLWK